MYFPVYDAEVAIYNAVTVATDLPVYTSVKEVEAASNGTARPYPYVYLGQTQVVHGPWRTYQALDLHKWITVYDDALNRTALVTAADAITGALNEGLDLGVAGSQCWESRLVNTVSVTGEDKVNQVTLQFRLHIVKV